MMYLFYLLQFATIIWIIFFLNVSNIRMENFSLVNREFQMRKLQLTLPNFESLNHRFASNVYFIFRLRIYFTPDNISYAHISYESRNIFMSCT